jgi:hypothetical protein
MVWYRFYTNLADGKQFPGWAKCPIWIKEKMAIMVIAFHILLHDVHYGAHSGENAHLFRVMPHSKRKKHWLKILYIK